jgi:hypothetical protein
MKTQLNTYVDVTTADELRQRAAEVNAPVGELADKCLRFALSRLNTEALRKWVTTLDTKRGRLGGGLTKNERALLAAFGRLKAKGGGAWRFVATELAAEAALRLTDAFLGLRQLANKGFITGGGTEEVDRWGRPLKSVWNLAEDAKRGMP